MKKRTSGREIIDAFIISGLAPNFEGMPNKLPDIVKRRLEGESYLKLANELSMSSGQIIEVIDEYRKRVAPLAIKWQSGKNSDQKQKKSQRVGRNLRKRQRQKKEPFQNHCPPSEEFEITDEDKSFEEEQE